MIEPHVPFSIRARISKAIIDPATVLPRIETADHLLETHAHWQARAVLEVVRQEAMSSCLFAEWLLAAISEEVEQP